MRQGREVELPWLAPRLHHRIVMLALTHRHRIRRQIRQCLHQTAQPLLCGLSRRRQRLALLLQRADLFLQPLSLAISGLHALRDILPQLVLRGAQRLHTRNRLTPFAIDLREVLERRIQPTRPQLRLRNL